MKLWLDDIRPMPPEYDTLATTAQQAIEHLLTGNVKVISLDHDLGPPEAGSGYQVAKWIEEQAFFGKLPKLLWAIHSANSVGIHNMRMALNNADRFWNQSGMPDSNS